jgi:hypothetical protein
MFAGHTQKPVTENHGQQDPHSFAEQDPRSELSQSENTLHKQNPGPKNQLTTTRGK